MLVTKEMLLGAFNGAFTGVTGGIAMFIFAIMVKSPVAVMLGIIVFLAITISWPHQWRGRRHGATGSQKIWGRSRDGIEYRGDKLSPMSAVWLFSSGWAKLLI